MTVQPALLPEQSQSLPQSLLYLAKQIDAAITEATLLALTVAWVVIKWVLVVLGWALIIHAALSIISGLFGHEGQHNYPSDRF